MTDGKLTSQTCSEKAVEARYMIRLTDNESAKVMLLHIAETWDRMATRLAERNGGDRT